MSPSRVVVRQVQEQDRQHLANLIHFEMHVHRHLDWRPPLDWIGAQPYLVGEVRGSVCSALVCPPDPPEVAWIRLFAAASEIDVNRAWQALWPVAQIALTSLQQPKVAAIPIEPWFREVLAKSGFEYTQNIVSLCWDAGQPVPLPRPASIRGMTLQDLPAVIDLDATAFAPLWRNSKEALDVAYRQAVLATVAQDGEQIVGYQISTAGPMGAHLARLAVHPAWQGCGIGYALVCNLLDHFKQRGARHITVNTQEDNQASLKLYQKVGFRLTGEVFPVYQLN